MIGNFFCCGRIEEDHVDDGVPGCEQPSSVILVQEKINLAANVGEGETTSKTENKCQPKTEFKKSTSGMQKEENQETTKVFEDNLDKEKCVRDNFNAKQKESSLENPCSNEELFK